MASKIVTMFAIAIVLAISVQIVTSNDPPKEIKADNELIELFSEGKNLQKLLAVFTLACADKEKAKKKIKSYRSTPSRVKKILEDIAENPKSTMTSLKPLRDALDKKFMAYGVYGRFIKPVWHVTKRIGCSALRLLGVSIYSTGELIQSLHDAVQESMQAAGHKPYSDVKELMENVDGAGNIIKEFGNKLDNKGESEIEKMHRAANPNLSNAAVSGSPEHTKKTGNEGSQEKGETAHRKTRETTHGEIGETAHGRLQQTEVGGYESPRREHRQQSDDEADHTADP